MKEVTAARQAVTNQASSPMALESNKKSGIAKYGMCQSQVGFNLSRRCRHGLKVQPAAGLAPRCPLTRKPAPSFRLQLQEVLAEAVKYS